MALSTDKYNLDFLNFDFSTNFCLHLVIVVIKWKYLFPQYYEIEITEEQGIIFKMTINVFIENA